MIREATHADIPILTKGIIEFLSGVGLEEVGLVPDSETIEFFVQDCIDMDGYTFLVAEEDNQIVGGIVGCVIPWEFNANIMALVEKGWFVPKEFRAKYGMAAMRLRKRFHQWGKEQGATVLCMVSTKREESPRVMQMYEKSGLKLIDSNFIGRL